MNIVKEYYRLSELERHFGISEEDIHYLAEKDEIRLSLFCNKAKFVIGGWVKDKCKNTKFCGYSIVNYQGAIELSPIEYQNLKTSGKLSAIYATLQQKDKIQHVSKEYPFQVNTPNLVIEEWRPKQIEQISWKLIPAMFLPYERENLEKQALDFLGLFVGMKTVADIKKSKQQKEMVLNHSERKFLTDDIRILHDTALEAVRILTGQKTKTTQQPALNNKLDKELVKKERNNDLHDLLKRIIVKKPSFSAKQIWAAIEMDFAIDEGEREFDEYNILRDVSASEILWESRYANGGTLKFSSLSVTVSNIRKKINTN